MVKRGGPNGRPYNPPWPLALAPQPFRPLFDCCVVVVWDQAAQLHLATWSHLNPTRPKKKTKIPLISKNNAATPSSGRSSPRPRVHLLIVVLLVSWTGRCGLIRPPGRNLMKP